MPPKLTNVRAFFAVAFLLWKQRYIVAIKNRVGAENILEEYYFRILKESDPQIYDQRFFDEVGKHYQAVKEQTSKARWWAYISYMLLVLCLLNLLENMTFYGTTINIRLYDPVFLLAYSGSKLHLVFLEIPTMFNRLILKAHARWITDEKSADLYMARYADLTFVKRNAANLVPYYSLPPRRMKILRGLLKFSPLLIFAFPIHFALYFAFVLNALIYSSMGIKTVGRWRRGLTLLSKKR
jgi:hypothetical protein